jgi:hypothetical protein
MSRPNDSGNNRDGVRRADPNQAEVDPQAAAAQDRVKADHAALEQSARRVDSSVSSDVRETPVGQDNEGQRFDSRPAGTGNDLRTSPQGAEIDPAAATRQDQVRADHDAMQESARRVAASVPDSVRDNPVRQANPSGANDAATDPRAAALQDQVRKDHDALQESARRVESSISAETRDTPIQHTGTGSGDADNTEKLDRAARNAEAARESARRVDESAPDNLDRNRH